MRPYSGLFWSGLVLSVGAALFYVLSVAGAFWPKATPFNDIGLYAVTVVLLGLGLGTLALRHTKLHPGEVD